MKNLNVSILLFLVLFLSSTVVEGQTNIEEYDNLKTVKMTFFQKDSLTQQVKKDGYSIEESYVSKAYYKNFSKSLSNCKPCIIEWYDENKNVVKEGVYYVEIYEKDKWAFSQIVGWFKTYYSNGELERTEKYTFEKNHSNYKTLHRGKKSYKNPVNINRIGTWTYFDDKGNVLKTENYDDKETKEEPQQKFYLVNSLDTTKKIRVAATNYFNTIDYDTLSNDSSILEVQMQFTGFITDLSDSTLKFQTRSEYLMIANKFGKVTKNNDCYTCGYYLGMKDSIKISTINLRKINFLSTNSSSRETLGATGQFISGVSLITTLVVAPLISINYKNGNFNQDRYYKFAGGGLLGLSIGIPLTFLNDQKKYNLIYKNGQKSKKHWFLQKMER
ncbi:hypothetical protein ACE193_07775 [Bernardetia sp. OM2101]|uniref:hypothetical protein n=1 Tax=Bernardetia sp. OM2101 TaxID=3344876 RepID=UPI0035D048D8